ncbi:uncharacterized protein ARMOST_19448 [Armillaria ostoyae]|uniref:Uncharacterized protein n=1 Tax=Armillaria ostoyae TaxID=47428 RepID=A0A284S4N7_ARMOS|nr:uncharacterized protein ARMOST_19448 [Armillaria ostoyae]
MSGISRLHSYLIPYPAVVMICRREFENCTAPPKSYEIRCARLPESDPNDHYLIDYPPALYHHAIPLFSFLTPGLKRMGMTTVFR